MNEDLRFPIGRFHYAAPFSDSERTDQIERIASLPDRLASVLTTLEAADWETPYRAGGWTVRQVVHHLPDSHLHAYTRFLFALAQNGTQIVPYNEERWVAVIDERQISPDLSLALLRALHARWSALLRTLAGEDFQRSVHHPDHNRAITVDELLGMYAWHGDHHLAHIESVTSRNR